MNLAQLTSADFKQIARLLEQRETLQAKVAAIDTQLANFASGEPAAPAKSKPGRSPARPTKVKRAARGAVKAAIIELIKGAGAAGITVKEIADRLGTKYNRVFTWFYNTGKTITEIKKVGPGKYAWGDTAARRIKSAPAPKPGKPTSKAKPKARAVGSRKRSGKTPAVGKSTVIGLVQGAGGDGITVKEIAGKLGVDLQAVYRWFSATGKKVPGLKKVAPAKYAWAG